MREDLIAELRELCAIEGRPLTVGERARTKIAMSEAAAALEAAREDGERYRWLRDLPRDAKETDWLWDYQGDALDAAIDADRKGAGTDVRYTVTAKGREMLGARNGG